MEASQAGIRDPGSNGLASAIVALHHQDAVVQWIMVEWLAQYQVALYL
jgi:hypothetical protein